MLTLAFDTATSAATAALVRDGEVLGERVSRAVTVLADADELLHESGIERAELTGLVVGTGPGSFTGLRLGLATARGLALALDLPVAGGSPGPHLGHIVAVGHSGGGHHDTADDPAMNDLYQHLTANGVHLSIRKYNDVSDVDRTLELVRSWAKTRPVGSYAS